MTQPRDVFKARPVPFLFVVSGPSGSGKGTALDFIEKNYQNTISRCPTYTTRPMRKGERQDKDYHFVSQPQFNELVASEQIFEFTRTYNDELYGSPITLINTDVDRHLLVELDFNGYHRIKTISHRKVIGIFVMPLSIEVLAERILARAPETNLERRLQRVSEQIAHAWSYDYLLLNDDRDVFLKRLEAIVSAELYRLDGLNFLTENWRSLDVTLRKEECGKK
jgi:guanylate kinase